MTYDVECPYCGKGQEINHDDGYGYDEDRSHEQECGDCHKNFVFTTSISFHYESDKADCLNGSPHQWGKPQELWVDGGKTLWRRGCKDCDTNQQEYDPEWRY